MNELKAVWLQSSSNFAHSLIPVERQVGLVYAMRNDLGVFNGLSEVPAGLKASEVLPIGDVPFIREVMKHFRICTPQELGYNIEEIKSKEFYGRPVWSSIKGNLHLESPRKVFVKPRTHIKEFSGFVPNGRELYEKDSLGFYEEQMEILSRLPPLFPIWISPYVQYGKEYRFYVCGNKILGCARYDQLELSDDETIEDMGTEEADDFFGASEVVEAFKEVAPAAYCLDFGEVVADGSTNLIEINDAWALGYYRWGTLSPEDYVKMLWARWSEMTMETY